MATQTASVSRTSNISVKNLQLPSGVLAPDVWGKFKQQPATITAFLSLRKDFNSAASLDALDNSTIHYGELSKRLRAACTTTEAPTSTNLGVGKILADSEEVVRTMARKGNGSFVLNHAALSLSLPKASVYGGDTRVSENFNYGKDGVAARVARTVEWDTMRVMVLVGVNEYERSAKQPLLVLLGVYLLPGQDQEALEERTVKVLKLERFVAGILEGTDFETLEALSHFALDRIHELLNSRGVSGARLRLKLEKPCAVPFADAPIIDIWEHVDQDTSASTKESTQTLNVVKPYI